MSVYLWLNIPFLRDWVPSMNYTMLTPSGLCISYSRLGFQAGFNVLKVHMFTYTSSCLLCSWLDFPPESNIVKVHKIIVSLIQYSNAERSSQEGTKCSYLRVRVFQAHDFFSHASNIMKVHYVSWKYKMSVYLWLNIPFMKDLAPSISYTMFTSSLCLSCSRLGFPAGFHVLKVHMFTSSSSCLSRSWLDFALESNIVKVHKVTVVLIQYSNAERSSQQGTECSYLWVGVSVWTPNW